MLAEKTQEAACSIEIISSEILAHYWVQYERQLLRDYGKIRLFLCLEEHYMIAVADPEVFEKAIIRLNFSDGRIGGRHSSPDPGYERTGYFRSVEFREDTLRLALGVRQCLLAKSWEYIKSDKKFSAHDM